MSCCAASTTAARKISSLIGAVKTDQLNEHTYSYMDASVFKQTGCTFTTSCKSSTYGSSEYHFVSPQILSVM